jgi:uncharacterized protein YndB with AHSA1/START domain
MSDLGDPMSDQRSTEHATFTIEREIEASPARVFELWADPAAKAQWFGPRDPANKLTLDFQVGGREHYADPAQSGMVFTYDALIQEIVPKERIVYSYTFDFDQTRMSASVVSVEFKPAGKGTRLHYTEQVVFFDGHDNPADREGGTRKELDRLDAVLSS